MMNRNLFSLLVMFYANSSFCDSSIISALNVEDFYKEKAPVFDYDKNPFVKNLSKDEIYSLKLFAVAYSDKNKAALINGQIVQENHIIGGATVQEIAKDYVLLSNDGGMFRLAFSGAKNE